MMKLYISLYVLFLVSISFVSTEKCEDFDKYNCWEYKYSAEDDKTKKCIYDDEVGKCQLKSCSELSSNKCYLYKSDDNEYNCLNKLGTKHCELQKCTDLQHGQCFDFKSNNEYKCQEIINETGCELKKCSDYEITKCGDFDTYDSETSCVPFNGVCQERKCSDYKSPNCDDFIPYDISKKCVAKNDNCEEVFKECYEMPYDDCDSYRSKSEEMEFEVKCTPKEDKSGCILKSCYYLNSKECSDFKFKDYELKICEPNENKSGCKITQCKDVTKGNCVEFNDKFSVSNKMKCVESEDENESKCLEVYKSCEEFDHYNCIEFHKGGDDEFYFEYTKDFKRCIPKSDNTNCEIKRCSELSPNECNRFNMNPYLDHTEQCMLKKDKTGCEIKTCEEMQPDECGLITNKEFIWKCEKEINKCVVKIKECSEMPLHYCEIAYELGKNCHLNESKTKCLSENDEDNDEAKEETDQVKFIELPLFYIILNLLIY